MKTFTPRLGTAEPTILAPGPGELEPAVFRAVFPPGAMYGLDVETTYLTDLGQFDPYFRVRLVQFATAGYAWVLRMDDPVQVEAARELLADPEVTFTSHTPMDVLSVRSFFGVDISRRNIDTHVLAALVNGDATWPKDLKTLASRFVGKELAEADEELEGVFRTMWVESGHRKGSKAAEVNAYGWNRVSLDDETYLTYAGLDAVAVRRLADVLLPMTRAPKELVDVEIWLAREAVRIQNRGMVVDVPLLEELYAEAYTETTEARKVVEEVAGCSPLSPKVTDFLAEHGADWDGLSHPLTDTGRPSLDKHAVKLLAGYPLDPEGRAVAEALVRFKGHQDMLNKTKGVRTKVTPDGRIHPVLHTLGAVTGRMSSASPNMQNFSKTEPRLRGLFLPSPGHVLVTADFDQVELRVVAALANEEKMIEVIRAGGDLHQLTADEIGIDRATAKMTNFLIVYGGGGKALSEQAELPLEEAVEIVATFRERYPAISALAYEVGRFGDYVRTVSGRTIPVTRNRVGDLRTYANINYLVQSSSRDILVDAWMTFAKIYGRGDLVWLPVHDELVIEAPESELDQVISEIEASMTFDFLGVPISASAVVLLDAEGTSRWMTSKHAEQVARERAA
jgi:DNA polymerase-1